MPTKLPPLRLVLVCLAAASVGLPVAIISIVKLLLFLGVVGLLLSAQDALAQDDLKASWRSPASFILLALAVLALSLLWTTAPLGEALGALGKYGKLLMIPIIAALIHSRKEAVVALAVFALGQLLLLLSSWMLFFDLPVPWATSGPMYRPYHAVFSSYLDQGLMSAVLAGLCWHFRALLPGKIFCYLLVLVGLLALANVFVVLKGRTGQVVSIMVISLAVMWELPKRYRASALLLPLLLVLVISAAMPQVRHRLAHIHTDLSNFSFDQGVSIDSGNSSGIRLHFWHRAVQSMSENPILGAGVGSWSSEFNRLEKEKSAKPESIAAMGNPHQDYLLWGVQLGLLGIGLWLAVLSALIWQALQMDELAARATVTAVAALAVAGLFNSVIYDALIGDFFCVTIGLLLAFGRRPPAV